MNIWIVQGSSGQYDDYYTWLHKAFYSKEAAQAWIDKQAEVDYEALRELENMLDAYRYDSREDFYEDEESLVKKAKEEIQAKYPHADLSQDYEFNGYRVVQHPIELEE